MSQRLDGLYLAPGYQPGFDELFTHTRDAIEAGNIVLASSIGAPTWDEGATH